MSKWRWLKEGMERAREERQSWPAWMRHAGTAGMEVTVARKVTSPRAASAASKVLRSKSTGRKSKTAAGSALSQREKPKRRAGTRRSS